MALLVITCVSDLDGFSEQVYDYFYSLLEKQKRFEDGRNLGIDKELISLHEEDNEIHVDGSTNVPKGLVKWALEYFLRENKEFKDYSVIEFGDTFTIGKVLPPSKMDLATCEICGFFTPHIEELQTHRMTHFGP